MGEYVRSSLPPLGNVEVNDATSRQKPHDASDYIPEVAAKLHIPRLEGIHRHRMASSHIHSHVHFGDLLRLRASDASFDSPEAITSTGLDLHAVLKGGRPQPCTWLTVEAAAAQVGRLCSSERAHSSASAQNRDRTPRGVRAGPLKRWVRTEDVVEAEW